MNPLVRRRNAAKRQTGFAKKRERDLSRQFDRHLVVTEYMREELEINGGDTGIKDDAQNAGVSAFMTKPFSPVELTKLVTELLDQ